MSDESPSPNPSPSSGPRGRDIGPVPHIADVGRREACARSLARFCEAYLRDAFTLPWTAEHLATIAGVENAAAARRSSFLFRMTPGTGNTSLCLAAALWVALNARRRAVYLIRETMAGADWVIGSLKAQLRFNDALAADHPEVCHPFRAIQGIAARTVGQTCGGARTAIVSKRDRVALPVVAPPANWPEHWPLRGGGTVPTAGVEIVAANHITPGIRVDVDSGAAFMLIDSPHAFVVIGGETHVTQSKETLYRRVPQRDDEPEADQPVIVEPPK